MAKKKLKFKNTDKVEYELVLRAPHKKLNADGLCDSPDAKKPKIWIDPKLLERRKLAVLIEEIVHAHQFELTEKRARKLAANLTRLIYTLGWRKAK